jgi:hypothetical protein
LRGLAAFVATRLVVAFFVEVAGFFDLLLAIEFTWASWTCGGEMCYENAKIVTRRHDLSLCVTTPCFRGFRVTWSAGRHLWKGNAKI